MTHSCRVLIIDDSAEARIVLTKHLKSLGFETIEMAENGRLGVDKVNSMKPGIVFLDGIMPEMDGLTALREIKRSSPETIVAISSSLSEKARVLEFKQAGADFYLLKPYKREKLEEVTTMAMAMLEAQARGTV